MPVYTLNFKNHGNLIYSTHHFESQDDEKALRTAHAMNSPGIGHGFELRLGDRIVLTFPLRPEKQ